MATARRFDLPTYVLSNRFIVFNIRAVLLVLLWASVAALVFLMYKGVIA